MTQRSLVLVKPDGFARGLTGEVIRRIEAKGYTLAALQILTPTRATLEQHYAEHEGKSFYEALVEFMASGPVTAVVRRGKFLVITAGGAHLVMHLARAGWLRWSDALTPGHLRPGKGPIALRVRFRHDGGAPGPG